MDTPARYAALAARYDGPVPPLPSLPPDIDATPAERLAVRKAWAWDDVRRLARRMLRARRAFAATGRLAHHREWAGLRRNLARALRCWGCYRDMLREEAGRRPH
jgi:hypothetical protein